MRGMEIDRERKREKVRDCRKTGGETDPGTLKEKNGHLRIRD